MKRKALIYPNGAKFAFTILDDTDDATVENCRPVYDLLYSLGLKTTKTVWVFDSPPELSGNYFAAETLSSEKYLNWVLNLSDQGFEIALHNATMSSSLRSETIRALDNLGSTFNQTIRLHCNHGQNRENLYWGKNRYSSRTIKRLLTFISKIRPTPDYEGDDPNSPFFWGDIAAERLSYIRGFTYRKLNGFQIPPGRPYIDLNKSSSLAFFNTSDAPDIRYFNQLVTPRTIDQLCDEGGWAIVSTHFGKGFVRNGRINPTFVATMEYLADASGWFAPVSELLDFLGAQVGNSALTNSERKKMEYAHIADRFIARLFDPFPGEYWLVDRQLD